MTSPKTPKIQPLQTQGQWPIDDVQATLMEALGAKGRVVVTAPTGSGKSTQVPVWCTQGGRRVLVVEPRRLACRSLARYVARLTGSQLGKGVGYAVRHDPRFDAQSSVVYATPGTVLRMIQERGAVVDGRLAGMWDVLVLDEFHERQLDLDLLLAFALNAGMQKLVIMSATLDVDRLGRFVDAEVLRGHGRMHPVSVSHLDHPTLPTVKGLEGRVVAAVESVMERSGDVLVFLPGKGEISSCASALRGVARKEGLEVLPLHGELKPEEQDKPFSPGDKRRVVLATNVAETSVTLPRIGVVIDSGLVKQTRYRAGRGVLELRPIAADSAEQRRGRAGRLGPGHCLRLWGRAGNLEARTPPEMLREGLSEAVLTAAACGFRIAELKFLDAPRPYAIDAAVEGLVRLGCLSPEGDITPIGKAVSALPLDAQHGRLIVAAQKAIKEGRHDPGVLDDAIDMVAAMGVGRRLLLPPNGELSDERQKWRAPGCDATRLIMALRHGKARRDALHPFALTEGRRVAQQLRRLMGTTPNPQQDTVDRAALAALWIEADPHTAFVRRKRKKGDIFGREGAEVELGRSALIDPKVEAIVVASIFTMKDSRGRIIKMASCAIPIQMATLRAAKLGKIEMEDAWVAKGRKLRCKVRRVYAGKVLESWEEAPKGPLCHQALIHCLLRRNLFKDGVAQTRRRISGWNLFWRLRRIQGACDLELEAWLKDHLVELGVESSADLALLESDDMVMPWPEAVSYADQQWIEREYPTTFSIGDAHYDIEYKPGRRTVILVQTQGKRRQAPSLSFLPSWGGWRIHWKKGNAVVTLR